MIWHFADVFETIAAIVPGRLALMEGAKRRTWREYEDRAARLAGALVAAGIAPDAKVAIYGHNSVEYLEAQFAVFKARGVPINVNYRYVEEELAYLFDNADVEAVFFDARFAPRLAAIRERLPRLKTFIRIDDGSGEVLEGAQDYDALIAAHAPLPRLRLQRRRYLHALHRGHHRHAQGRHVPPRRPCSRCRPLAAGSGNRADA